MLLEPDALLLQLYPLFLDSPALHLQLLLLLISRLVALSLRTRSSGDSIQVRGATAHHAAMVRADVPHPDVVAHDDEDFSVCAVAVPAIKAIDSTNAESSLSLERSIMFSFCLV